MVKREGLLFSMSSGQIFAGQSKVDRSRSSTELSER